MENSRVARPAYVAVILLALSQWITGQPLVNAGDNQLGITLSTAKSGSVRLMGEADPYDSLRWVQLTGPHVTINEPTSTISLITLPDTGAYVFELRVFFQGATYSDSVTITVRPDQPFVVLAPANNALVPSGQPYTIKWHMDPSIPCIVRYSVDGGRTFVLVNVGGGVRDSIVWNVPSGLTPGTQGIVIVKDYATEKQSAEGTFVVTSTGVEAQTVERPAPGIGVRFNREGVLHVACTGDRAPGSVTILDLAGKCVLSTRMDVPAAIPRMLLYQAIGKDGVVYRGRVRDSR